MEESNGDIQTRHRHERKELQSQIQALKKSACKGDKKKRKEVLEEIAKLEADIDKRHAEELNTLNESAKNLSLNESITITENDKVEDATIEPVVRLSKAQKRRDKKAQEEREKEAEIKVQEELNKNGPRMLEQKAIKEILTKRQLKVHPILSDGDCLYNALKHQLEVKMGAAYSVVKLRQLTGDYIAQNKENFINYMSNPDTDECLNEEEFDEYCQAVRSTKTWGGHIELKAIANVFRVPIEVVQGVGPSIILGEDFPKPPVLVITYHRKMYSLGEHYNSTITSEGDGSEDENIPEQ